MERHAASNQSKDKAESALKALARLLAVQAAREALAPSTHDSISDNESKSADTSSSSTAGITANSSDTDPAEAD